MFASPHSCPADALLTHLPSDESGEGSCHIRFKSLCPEAWESEPGVTDQRPAGVWTSLHLQWEHDVDFPSMSAAHTHTHTTTNTQECNSYTLTELAKLQTASNSI